ncbi:ankyrin [Coprinopsis marcescibilis]|uniref:Ankyrin n=1 Tax=Coprinopsis marcescibilis TaxID=230819 RepID=A0A5C3KLL0_COPMA|nr:ankyrin [Coprinopsis marcescibilis]
MRSKDTVKILLGVEGVDYNCVDAKDRTLLMMAVKQGWADVVALLLEREGIKVESRDDEGKTALAHAISRGHLESFHALLKVDSISAKYATSKGLNYLMLAAKSSNEKLIRSVLQLKQFNINARDIYGRTAVAYAVKSKRYDAVEALLEVEGVDVHCVADDRRTLLMDAASSYDGPKMINRFLGLGLGANINAADIYGWTALFFAVFRWKLENVSALLKVEGIDLSVRDVKGRTVLMFSKELGSKACTELLRKAGAS